MRPWMHWGILILSLATSLSCARVYHQAGNQVTSYRIDDRIRENGDKNPEELMIAPYRRSLVAEMNQVIAIAAHSLDKGPGGTPESTLGNWVADAILARSRLITGEDIDFAICNSGGLRIPALPSGPVTRGHFYELMPFDNYLVTMSLPGEVIRQLFNHMAGHGGWPISSGVSYQIKEGKAQQIMINGEKLKESDTYEVALSDYLAEGGNNCAFLKDFPNRNLGVFYREALIEYAQMQQVVSKSLEASIEGRVVSLDQ